MQAGKYNIEMDKIKVKDWFAFVAPRFLALTLVLGLVILGLEAGWIYAYKAGWPVSTAFIVQSAILAGFLLAVGYVLYREPLAWNKVAGVVICLIGLYVINYK